MSDKVAVVTGSNKGIGYTIVKGLCQRYDGVVYLTSRDDKRGRDAVKELNKLGLFPEYHQLDVADRESVIKLRDHIRKKHGGLDILINNAAVTNSVIRQSYAEDKNIIDINYRAILTVQELIFPLVRDNGRILNISSSCGHLSNIRNKYWVDRLSRKDLTVDDINEHRNISVNSVHPGVVRTDMASGIGMFTAEAAADTPLYLVLDAPESLKRSYIWYDRTVVDWYDNNADYFFTLSEIYEWYIPSLFANFKNYFKKVF